LLRYQIGEYANPFFKARKEITDENINNLMVEAVLKVPMCFALLCYFNIVELVYEHDPILPTRIQLDLSFR
jgi:hypothetical protein